MGNEGMEGVDGEKSPICDFPYPLLEVIEDDF